MAHGRVLGTVLLVATLAMAAAACEPAPPRPVFLAVGDAAGPDAHPGDGTCATAADECSLQAAIEEADALPRARIVATGQHPPFAATVTGDIELLGDPESGGSDASRVQLTVAQGAGLLLRDMSVGSLAVDGTVIAERVGLGFSDGDSSTPPNLDVGPTGNVVAVKVSVLAWTQVGVRNQGRLSLRYTTFWSGRTALGPPDAVLTTSGSGTTTLAASVFLGSLEVDMVDACAGTPPVSDGANASYDGTCGLTGPGDVEGADELTDRPGPDSIRTDAIPVGTLGCQEEPADTFGAVQAVDGNDDGVAACDIGATEAS